MEYLSIRQISEKWGISVRRIQVLCSEGRISGATKIGFYWAIPADAEKPSDERIKNDITTAIGLSAARTGVLLKEMSDVEYEGTNTNRKYRLAEEDKYKNLHNNQNNI